MDMDIGGRDGTGQDILTFFLISPRPSRSMACYGNEYMTLNVPDLIRSQPYLIVAFASIAFIAGTIRSPVTLVAEEPCVLDPRAFTFIDQTTRYEWGWTL